MKEEIVWKTVPNTNGRYKANTEGVIYDNVVTYGLATSERLPVFTGLLC